MKKTLITALLLCLAFGATAQQHTQVKYGLISYNTLLKGMAGYATMQNHLKELRAKFEKETEYNEQEFQQQFASYMQGQKDFPTNILLKRQRDLQDCMEKGLAFRAEADSLLRAAEAEMTQQLRHQLDSVVREVGIEHGYELILNTDGNALPFVHPELCENADEAVRQKLTAIKP